MSPSRRAADSTARLLELCAGYFTAYVATGIAVKYFTGGLRTPPVSEIAYLVHNTLGGTTLCLLVVVVFGWVRLESNRMVAWGPLRFPVEAAYIVPSGVCTAVVIPTTTLMYTLPISVMVAMVIMRGSVIVISRLVDAIQIRQGILHRRVAAEENWAVVFALLAIGVHVLLVPFADLLAARGVDLEARLGVPANALRGGFDFLRSMPAMVILSAYIVAYAIRLYLMNYFKNTRGPGVRQDNRGFFAIEQVAASATLALVGVLLLLAPRLGSTDPRVAEARAALLAPDAAAVLSGIPFGIVAFFSVFLFMFHGRTATFTGLVNRLTSLMAGTAATLILWLAFGTKAPSLVDWTSLGFILVAVAFLSAAERRRARTLAAPAGGGRPAAEAPRAAPPPAQRSNP
jgi:hypothetical protein